MRTSCRVSGRLSLRHIDHQQPRGREHRTDGKPELTKALSLPATAPDCLPLRIEAPENRRLPIRHKDLASRRDRHILDGSELRNVTAAAAADCQLVREDRRRPLGRE